MKKKFDEYERNYMKGFWFDLIEMNRNNWIISHICGVLGGILKDVIQLLFTNKNLIKQVKHGTKKVPKIGAVV